MSVFLQISVRENN